MSEQVTAPKKTPRKSKTISSEVMKFRMKQAEAEMYEDVRDDVISIVRNQKLTFEQIHEKFGPTPKTLQKWLDKEVGKPTFSKLQSTLRACGRDLDIVGGRRKRK